MVVNPKLIKDTPGISMTHPKKIQGDARSSKRSNQVYTSSSSSSRHNQVPPPPPHHQPPSQPWGYALLALGSHVTMEGGKKKKSHTINEYGHRLVMAYCFGAAPSEDCNIVLHTCHQGAGCHQPHHLLYGSIADNNLRGTKAIARYKELAKEQDREYYGIDE
jgi:hypothetical protein